MPENEELQAESSEETQPQAPEQTQTLAVDEQQSRLWGSFCHLAGLISFIGPLVIWLIKKDEYPFVDKEGKEALNFQLSMLIYFVIASMLCVVLIGFVLIPALTVADLILIVMATVKANSGESFRYPFTIRFVK